jgi:oligopeptide/dipeptide ABC transporter ATP-binding protein
MSVSMGDTLLSVEDLHVRFDRGGQRVHAVSGLAYQLRAGQTLAIVGESGSGKTVSSRALMGLLPPSARVTGSARIDGVELIGMPEEEMRRRRGADLAMIFQDPTRSLNPTMRIGTQITEAIRAHARVDSAAAKRRAHELLSLVRIADPVRRFHEYPHQLSGGMRQRVVIAIALASDPKVLIADEATTALDVTTQAQIMDLLAELRSRLGTAIILISHDLGLAASYADDVMVMYAGRAVEYAPTRILFAQMRMPYTRALLDAIPRLDRESHAPLPVTPGQPPDLTALPPGCPFEPRCARAMPECPQSRPPLVQHEVGHWWACWNPCEDGGPP